MPRAPATRSNETVVVPRASNLAKPYGYRSVGGRRESLQQKRTTKSPRRSTCRVKVGQRGQREGTHHSESDQRLPVMKQNANTTLRHLSHR